MRKRLAAQRPADNQNTPAAIEDAIALLYSYGHASAARRLRAYALTAAGVTLPLAARREWMLADADTIWMHEDGMQWSYLTDYSGVPGWRLYRAVTHDEHGLTVIPRTADMSPRARYRWWDMATGWVYERDLPLRVRQKRQRIEDCAAAAQESP